MYPDNPVPGSPPATSPLGDVLAVSLRQAVQRAIAAYQGGDFAEAERLCRSVLASASEFDALQLLGVIAAQTGRSAEAIGWLAKAISVDPTKAGTHFALGSVLHSMGERAEALENYERAIALAPNFADAHYNRGNVLSDLKRYTEALESHDRAIAIDPAHLRARINRGTVLRKLKRHAEALDTYDRVIALQADHAGAHYNRGNLLADMRRNSEALESYERATTLDPNYADAFHRRGVALMRLRRYREALTDLERAIALKPDHNARNALGVALHELKRYSEALECYEREIALRPGRAEVWINRGATLHELRRYPEALESHDRAIALEPDHPEAHYNRGNTLRKLKRQAEALDSYRRALLFKPDAEFWYGNWLHTKMQICDWDDLAQSFGSLVQKIERHEKASEPFFVLATPTSLATQRTAAETWVKERCPATQALPRIGKAARRDRIHVGYFSADFNAHAMMHLMAELFELHDKSRFRVTAFSFGPDIKDAMRERLVSAFHQFIDVRERTDAEVAMLAREFEVDIAVDLNGFTEGGRTNIFAMRAAPIQVNYLAYPGTLGAEYIDYLIADETIIPAAHRDHYAERIVYLPESYQVNDTKRPIADTTFTRKECGLPEEGFVFCCFNNNYKITPTTFDLWMRILDGVGGSVLWLIEDNDDVANNLRREAANRGIDERRLVFAPRISSPEHLARHRLADLFLDTVPYNAHTTASDALWAGLPVLTRLGDTFAGRVAASLLNALRLPELITATPAHYVERAIELATTDAEALKEIKRRLIDNRLTSPLFDTRLFATRLETAYAAMYENYHANLPPTHIYVRHPAPAIQFG